MEQKIWDIIAKEVTGEAAPEEQKLLHELSLSDNETAEALKDAKNHWAAAGEQEVLFDTEKGWDRFMENTGQSAKVRPIHIKKGPALDTRFFLKIAAAITVLVASTLIIYNFIGNSSTIVASTGADEKLEVLLADGSTIWLNENSSLEYPRSFDGNERKVKLEGEAFFEVAKDQDHPFMIETSKSVTTVLGTSFNIRSYNSTVTEIAVVTGKVSFSAAEVNKEVILTAGNSAKLYSNNELVKLEKDNSNALSWKTNKLEFNETLLEDVISDLEHHFRIDIKAENKGLTNCRFTGSFDQPTMEEVLKTLSFTLNINYKEQEGQVILKGEGCRQ